MVEYVELEQAARAEWLVREDTPLKQIPGLLDQLLRDRGTLEIGDTREQFSRIWDHFPELICHKAICETIAGHVRLGLILAEPLGHDGGVDHRRMRVRPRPWQYGANYIDFL